MIRSEAPTLVFIIGGSALTGPTVITSVAPSDAAAARLEALGASALRGSLQDLDRLKAGVEGLDLALVHGAG